MFKSIAAGAALLSLYAMPAAAQEVVRSFSGLSVTAIAGADNNNRGPNGGTGVLYGAQVGYDVRSAGMVFGAEAELTGSTDKNCVQLSGTAPVSSNTFCLKAGRDIYVGGRVGFVASSSTLIYGKAGYTNARLDESASYSATPTVNFAGSRNYDGFRVGAGIEQSLTGNVSVKAEYRYSRYGSVYDRHQGVAGVMLRF